MWRKKIKQKKIWERYEYQSVFNFKNLLSFRVLIKGLVIVFSILFVLYFGQKMLLWAHVLMWHFTKDTVETLSKRFGEDMKKDEMWNVNVLLIGHGGKNHAWWLLADTIIVASWNPKLWAVSMISIPRDLYINSSQYHVRGKINSVFASAFYKSKGVSTLLDTGVTLKDLDEETEHALRMKYASQVMADELSKVTWLTIPYYAIVDFSEFEALIDHLWWIDIDVPKKIYDRSYPEGKKYVLFTVPKGMNHFDGATALKYARSRHSTSDFDRSARQQQIIQAVLDKITAEWKLASISKIKSLYADYSKMVFTNISSQELIGMVKYVKKIKHMFSFVLTSECSYKWYNLVGPGCFLYVPPRDLFGGSSVLLPNGSTPNKVSFYDYINHFVFFVAHKQEYLIENPRIVVKNGIDKVFARKLGKRAGGNANQIAVKLKKYAFNVVDVDNADDVLTGTSLYLGTWVYPFTVEALKSFVNVVHIYTGQLLWTGVDMELVLWNSYLEDLWKKRFNYEK